MQIIDNLYIEYTFTITPAEPWSDILAAQLGEQGFDSFENIDSGLKAYILASLDRENILENVDIMQSDLCDIAFAKAEIAATNWNEEWEKNFHPIVVDDRCEVRAPFHASNNLEYDIVIEPKMSFGTGHHQTTHMMIQHLLQENLIGLRVLDMGSGTGVLGILAEMRGATAVDAIDIDTWCYENALENVARNHAVNTTVILGGAEQLSGKSYDFIIANINRNILIADIPTYANTLVSGGTILFSGFYTEDLDAIKECCKVSDLIYSSHIERDNWVSCKMIKS